MRTAFARQSGYLERDGQYLHTYASGDGSLSHCWLMEGKSGLEASGRKLKLKDVRACLMMKANRYKLLDGWQIVKVNTRYVLARLVKRTGKDRLYIPMYHSPHGVGGSFTYTIDEKSVWWKVYKEVNSSNFRAFHWSRGERREVFNESLLMVLRYFLNHEETLTQQFGRK